MRVRKPTRGKMPIGLIANELEVGRILQEAEMPVLYVTHTLQGQELLAYVADVNEEGIFTLLVPIVDGTLNGLEQGSRSILDALSVSPPFLHWTDGKTSELWAYSIDEIPKDHLPEPRLNLYLGQEPVFRTRVVGEEIVLGRIPASAVAFVADSTRKAMKTVLDYVFAVNTEGRPRDEHRTMYDLPIQSFAFSSFELSFGAPETGVFSPGELRQAAEKLQGGLAWASGSDNSSLPGPPEETEAILRAVLFLTPPSAGPITEVHLSGQWVKNRQIVLTRKARKRVQEALRDVDDEVPQVHEGRLGELDTDKLTFTLRSPDEKEEIKGGFSEELLEEMMNLLTKQVVIIGIANRGKFTAHFIVEKRNALDEQSGQTPDGIGEP